MFCPLALNSELIPVYFLNPEIGHSLEEGPKIGVTEKATRVRLKNNFWAILKTHRKPPQTVCCCPTRMSESGLPRGLFSGTPSTTWRVWGQASWRTCRCLLRNGPERILMIFSNLNQKSCKRETTEVTVDKNWKASAMKTVSSGPVTNSPKSVKTQFSSKAQLQKMRAKSSGNLNENKNDARRKWLNGTAKVGQNLRTEHPRTCGPKSPNSC